MCSCLILILLLNRTFEFKHHVNRFSIVDGARHLHMKKLIRNCLTYPLLLVCILFETNVRKIYHVNIFLNKTIANTKQATRLYLKLTLSIF